jgi:hypothetical protein
MSDLFHSPPINEFPIDRYRQRGGRREQLYRVIRYDRVRLVWVALEEWRPARELA